MIDESPVSRAAASALAGALLWLALTGGAGWAVGALAVLVATTASAWLAPRGRSPRIALGAALSFVPWFLTRSLTAGVDVARRALRPRGRLAPIWIEYPLQRLSAGAPVRMFVACACLTPGTLGAERTPNGLRVHLLDRSMAAGLAELEDRIASLYRIGSTA